VSPTENLALAIAAVELVAFAVFFLTF